MSFLVLKYIHIVSIVCWFAALFYLPRLFVYHADNILVKDFTRIVKIQEKKLYFYISIPAFILTMISGIGLLVINPSIFAAKWIHIKILFVIFLIFYQLHLGYLLRLFEQDKCSKSGRYFRIYNEIPTILLLVIVYLAVLKPF